MQQERSESTMYIPRNSDFSPAAVFAVGRLYLGGNIIFLGGSLLFIVLSRPTLGKKAQIEISSYKASTGIPHNPTTKAPLITHKSWYIRIAV